MAICHTHFGSVPRSRSAKSACDYQQREGQYENRKSDLIHAEEGNLPKWADNANEFFRAADELERKNARLAVRLEFALPVELAREQRIELARKFATEIVADRQPYALALHEHTENNPHAHLLFSERALDGIERTREQFFKRANSKNPEQGGAAKDRAFSDIHWVKNTRARWAECANAYLAEHGYEIRIDHRSLKEQGIDRLPQRHLGPAALRMEERGIHTHAGDRVAEREREITLHQAERSLENELTKTGTLLEGAREIQTGRQELQHEIIAEVRGDLEADKRALAVEMAREAARKQQELKHERSRDRGPEMEMEM